MKIAFIAQACHANSIPANGDTIRYGGVGVSGTHQSFLMVAEYLASKGHEVYLMFDYFSVRVCETVRGVHYIDSYGCLDNMDLDCLVVASWHNNYNFNFASLKKLITWCECYTLDYTDRINYFLQRYNAKYGIVHISDWSRSSISQFYMFLEGGAERVNKEALIPNPLMIDVVDVVEAEANAIALADNKEDYVKNKKPKSFIFHPVWERGGSVAKRVFDKLGWDNEGGSFTRFDYSDNNMAHDKLTVFREIAKSEYFVYPLVLENGFVHKDTFGCVVAEACALGAIVITFPVAALPQHYGNSAVFVGLPSDANLEELTAGRNIIDRSLLSEESVDNIVNAIRDLEANPSKKEEIRKNARENVRRMFNIEAVGKLWEEFLEGW